MANEITVYNSMKLVNGDLRVTKDLGRRTIDQTTANYSAGTLDVGTDWEQVPYVDIGTEGWAWFLNLDDTETIEIGAEGVADYHELVSLRPAEIACFPLAAQPWVRHRGASGTVSLEYVLLER